MTANKRFVVTIPETNYYVQHIEAVDAEAAVDEARRRIIEDAQDADDSEFGDALVKEELT